MLYNFTKKTNDLVPRLFTLASEGIFESLSHIVTVVGLDRFLGSKNPNGLNGYSFERAFFPQWDTLEES